jgi:hypothetical protein
MHEQPPGPVDRQDPPALTVALWCLVVLQAILIAVVLIASHQEGVRDCLEQSSSTYTTARC